MAIIQITPEMHKAAMKIQAAWKFKKMRQNAQNRLRQRREAEQWQVIETKRVKIKYSEVTMIDFEGLTKM